jgi:Fe-S oxidoreductase
MGFDMRRDIPEIYNHTLRDLINIQFFAPGNTPSRIIGKLYLFIDEFTEYNDVNIGIETLCLFRLLGYDVETVPHRVSGRTFITKGMLRKARKIADYNVSLFSSSVSERVPLVGIEPSCILSFRDEYPELVSPELREAARKLASNTFTVEEFIVREWKKGLISSSSFTKNNANVVFHGHCQQKSLTTTAAIQEMLSIPENYTVTELKTGCCGMAGTFGYEKKYYSVSMHIGELSLFPQVRETDENTIIVASGTGCRQHIEHGTGRKAKHPVEVLFEALK